MNYIELAKQAGFERLGHTDDDWVCYPEDIKAFAELVAAQERKACAKIARKIGNATKPDDWALDKCQEIEAAIRARETT